MGHELDAGLPGLREERMQWGQGAGTAAVTGGTAGALSNDPAEARHAQCLCRRSSEFCLTPVVASCLQWSQLGSGRN